MKRFYLILALIIGVGLVAPAHNVLATSYDSTGAMGALPEPPPSPMINNHGLMGQALLGEFFRATVKPDAFYGDLNVATYVQIENTSGAWVAAHLRMRAGRYSIEVVDFPILLSPYDVFWFQFEAIPGATAGSIAGVRIVSTDIPTVEKSGLPTLFGVQVVGGVFTVDLKTTILDQFTALAAAYKTPEELTQGYIELFPLWQMTFPNASRLGTFKASTANFYTVLADAWVDAIGAYMNNPTPTGLKVPSYTEDAALYNEPASRLPLLPVGNVLTGRVFIGDYTKGLYTGYTMRALKNFRTNMVRCWQTGTCTIDSTSRIDHRDQFIRSTQGGGLKILPGTILYRYGTDVAYLEPDWATSFGPTWNDGDNYYGGNPYLVFPCANEADSDADCVARRKTASWGLDEVDDSLAKQQMSSSYFNGGFMQSTLGPHTFTAMAINFPTKYLHYFFDDDSGIPSNATGLTDAAWPVGDASKAGIVRGKLDVKDDIGSVGTGVGIWNFDEFSLRFPSPFVNTTLPWEVMFIPIGEESYDAMQDFCFLTLDDASSPFVLGITGTTFPGGFFILQDFRLQGGICGASCRVDELLDNDDATYDNTELPLLNALADSTLPASAVMLDFEMEGSPGTRIYMPSWDNPDINTEIFATSQAYPKFGYGGYVK